VYDNIDCEIILQLMRAQTFRNSIANLAKCLGQAAYVTGYMLCSNLKDKTNKQGQDKTKTNRYKRGKMGEG